MKTTSRNRTEARRFVCLVVMSALLAAFSSCSSDIGEVKKQTLSITGMTLSWTTPTTYTDGLTPLTVSSYKLYYGTSPGSYPASISISGTATKFDASQAVFSYGTYGATYYFVLTALDASGSESDPSNVVSAFVW